MAQRTVRADYDAEARYWYVFDSDVPGLSTGAETLEALEANLPDLIVELLDLNAHLIVDASRLAGPHSFRLVAPYEASHAIAA